MSPRVSVIIPTYNCQEYICEAVESVLNQTFKDFELIIVNDGSTDGTEDLLKNYVDRFPKKIKYIRQENKGVGIALNRGILESSGELIAFLGSDDLWLSNKLAEQISVFGNHPDVGLVHTNAYGFGGPSGTYLGRYWMTPEQIKKHSGYIFFEYFFRKIRITASTVMVKRECLDKVGLHDEKLSKLGSEDRELFLRILWHYEAIYINEPLARYRDREGSMGKNYEKMIIGQKIGYDKVTSLYKLPNSYRKRAMSSVYHEWAGEFYGSLQIKKGFILQLQAIKHNPKNVQAYILTRKMIKQLLTLYKHKVFKARMQNNARQS